MGDRAVVTAAATADRACCCSARPVVEVLMPVTEDRPLPVEILLCGHHYRTSLPALVRAGADVFGVSETGAAFLTPVT